MNIYLFVFFVLLGMVASKGSKEYSEVPLCESDVETKFPKTLFNVENVEKRIINNGQIKEGEGLVFETCKIGKGCDRNAIFPVGYQGICVQKYSNFRFLSVDVNKKGKPSYDSFPIPTNCKCEIQREDL